jgi:CheY-like chemotaxis protein
LAEPPYTIDFMRDSEQTEILVAVADLIFGARIRGAAEQQGVALTFVRSLVELQARAPGVRTVLLDLDTRWLDAPAAIRALRAAPQTATVRIIAFVSHVRADAIEAARAAGADRVLARSAFVRELPALLAE